MSLGIDWAESSGFCLGSRSIKGFGSKIGSSGLESGVCLASGEEGVVVCDRGARGTGTKPLTMRGGGGGGGAIDSNTVSRRVAT